MKRFRDKKLFHAKECLSNCRGFTLVEILAALGVFTIISMVALSAISNTTQDKLLNDLRMRANETARDTMNLIYEDIQKAGYQIKPSSAALPQFIEVINNALGPYQLKIRCTVRTGRTSEASNAGDRELKVADISRFQGLVNSYLIYTFEGETQALRITGIDTKIKFNSDPLKKGLPAGALFVVVDTVEYVYDRDSGVLTRSVNGSNTHNINGVDDLTFTFVLEDGSTVTTPNAAQSAMIRYADCNIRIRHERRVPHGRTYNAVAPLAQRVALENLI